MEEIQSMPAATAQNNPALAKRFAGLVLEKSYTIIVILAAGGAACFPVQRLCRASSPGSY